MPASPSLTRSRWSISKLATETGLDRRTVSAALEDVPSAGTENGHPVYSLRDAFPALAAKIAPRVSTQDGEIDPASLINPKDYKDYWSGTESRIRAEKQAGALAPAEQIEDEIRAIIGPLTAWLETLPDILERDADLSAEQAEILRRATDSERARIAGRLAE